MEPSNRNAFRESYGLVVVTKNSPRKVMLVERKIPYCVHNILLSKMTKIFTNTSKCFDRSDKDWRCLVRCIVSEMLTECKKDTSLHDNVDFRRFEYGLVFEDQYDYPHGQMSTKTKKTLLSFIKQEENVNSPMCQFLSKLAGFITAFMEFEEETGYTFRFDFQTVLRLKTVVVPFTGLDGYDYLQKFFILEVDKLQKLIRKHRPDNSNNQPTSKPLNQKCRKALIFREIDKQTYEPRLIEIEKVVDLMLNQQKVLHKYDYKHILPILLTQTNKIYTEIQTNESITEQLFLNFVEKIDPDVYNRCVQRMKWREH